MDSRARAEARKRVKLISFSIWGNNPMYHEGMYENIRLAPQVYPEWTVRVYHDDTVPQDVVQKMKEMGAQTFHITKSKGSWDGLFWRFYPAADQTIDAFIVRDADSRINARERAAVNEWIGSNRGFHTMRDHWNHNVPIMGGMWGMKRLVFPAMVDYINDWLEFNAKGTDQTFLQTRMWDQVKGNALAHDRYHDGFFKLPDGTIKTRSECTYFNKWDNCGEDNDPFFPRGKIKFNDGQVFQRLDVYHYDPIEHFGDHEVRPFPPHDDMGPSRYVGESSQDFHKVIDHRTETYVEQ
jgi:hypothetical protein